MCRKCGDSSKEATNGTSGGDNAATGIACREQPGHGQRRAAAPAANRAPAASEPVATLAAEPRNKGVFQAYRGTDPPAFANQAELACARVLGYHGVPWEYEPRTFVLEEDEDGRTAVSVPPGFYLPEQNLYVEVTVMKQSLVTRKNRKLRKLRERYPT